MSDKRYFLKKHAIQKSIKDILLYLKMMRDYLTDWLLDRLIDKETDEKKKWLTDWLADWMIDKQTAWLTNKLLAKPNDELIV